MRNALFCILVCIAPLLAAQAGATRFQRTVEALQLAQPELRGRFATIALVQLAEVYMAEADLARRQAEDSSEPPKLRGWSRAVDRYAAQLVLVLEDIETGFPVELRNHSHEVSSVAVGGRVVMLAHPRLDQQSVYERDVLQAFCTGQTCARLTAQLEGHAPLPVATAIKPRWDFGPDGPVCSYRGVSLAFAAGGRLGDQRSLCEQLLQEMESLALELAWQQRHGVEVDWAGLSSRSIPGKPLHVVTLNAAGEAILLPLPLLHSTPGLLPRLLPWLQARHLRDSDATVSLDAGELGWE